MTRLTPDAWRMKAVEAILAKYPPGIILPHLTTPEDKYYTGLHASYPFVSRQRVSPPHKESIFLPQAVYSQYFNTDTLSGYGMQVYRPATDKEWDHLLSALPQLLR